MKNRAKSSGTDARRLIFRERIFITVLVMSVMAVFEILVGFLVPAFQKRNIRGNAYTQLNQVIVNSINATYGYYSEDDILIDGNSQIFVYIIDSDGSTFLPKDNDNDVNRGYVEYCLKNYPTVDSRSDFLYENYYFSVMDSEYIEKNLDIEKSPDLITRPIDVPDETLVYAGIDRKSELEANSSFAMTLLLVLGIGFLLMIPAVYVISNRVMKPTKDTIRHEKEFVANASHELKTPLAIITAEAEVLSDRNPENADYVRNIIQQCKNMNETVLDMIALSKLETAPKVLEEVRLSELVMNLCLSFDAVSFEREIDYSYDIEEGIVLEKADRKNLTRLVNLLLDNAMKYTQGEKIIRVSLRNEKKNIVFRVYNTGCQVHDEDREKVFERFYQGKSGDDNERKGSGLGLAIVKQICDTYHYQVSIRSHYKKDMCFEVVMR